MCNLRSVVALVLKFENSLRRVTTERVLLETRCRVTNTQNLINGMAKGQTLVTRLPCH